MKPFDKKCKCGKTLRPETAGKGNDTCNTCLLKNWALKFKNKKDAAQLNRGKD